jgi:hypothetical protein
MCATALDATRFLRRLFSAQHMLDQVIGGFLLPWPHLRLVQLRGHIDHDAATTVRGDSVPRRHADAVQSKRLR